MKDEVVLGYIYQTEIAIKKNELKQSSDSTTDSDDNTDDYFTEIDKANNRDEMLEKERIIDLIEKVAKENSNKVQNNDRIEKSDRNQLSQNDKLGDAFDNTIQTQILAKLLSQDMNKEIKTKARIKPNRLVPTVSVNEVDRNDNVVTGLEDYSKIYVVLNPQAVDRSKNKNAFNELISKILSLSSLTSKKDNQRQRKPRRYKGFVVKEDMPQRRFRQAMARDAKRPHKQKSDSDSDGLFDEIVDYLDDRADSNKFDNHNDRLRKQRIIDLIESVANQKKSKARNNKKRINRKEKANRDLNTYESRNDNREKLEGDVLQNLVIEQLLSRGLKEEEIKAKSKDYILNRIQPDREAFTLKGDKFKRKHKNKKPTRLEDYSKIVVVFNPEAVRKRKNKNSINNLVSKILSVSSATSENGQKAKRKPFQYERFDVNEDRVQRRYSQSKERHARRDSMAEEYNQKRSIRNGGVAAGRTAIPYIKHRGDIYEREE
ncbi:hypothetical protein SFRURICE_003639 [Spodoptera frugiperda]|nr:hypothetical protein SFRURICE_003639 [Spodoptera frugiperda]